MSRIDLKHLQPGDLVEYQQLVAHHTARGTFQRWHSTDVRPGASDHAPPERRLHRLKASAEHHPPKRGYNVSKNTEEMLRRQVFPRTLNLAAVGIGRCPTCQQCAELFSRRRATPGEAKERCLDCWKVER